MRILGASLAAACIAGTLLAAPSQVRIVHLSALGGVVFYSHQLADHQRPRWSRAILSQPVVQGERLRTGPNSEAEVEFECDSAVRLTPNSQVGFPQLELSAKGVPLTTVEIRRGVVYFSMRKSDTRDFRVEVPGGAVEKVDGDARFRVTVGADQETPQVHVAVSDGKVQVQAAGHSYEIKKSRQLAWSPGDAPSPAKADQRSDRWAKWSAQRDALFDRSLLHYRLAQFAGADMANAPGSTAVTTGAPESMWNSGGFLGEPSSYLVDGNGVWTVVNDLPTGMNSARPIPACARY